jgi:hypothetical protein
MVPQLIAQVYNTKEIVLEGGASQSTRMPKYWLKKDGGAYLNVRRRENNKEKYLAFQVSGLARAVLEEFGVGPEEAFPRDILGALFRHGLLYTKETGKEPEPRDISPKAWIDLIRSGGDSLRRLSRAEIDAVVQRVLARSREGFPSKTQNTGRRESNRAEKEKVVKANGNFVPPTSRRQLLGKTGPQPIFVPGPVWAGPPKKGQNTLDCAREFGEGTGDSPPGRRRKIGERRH